MADVAFGDLLKSVCVACVPDANVGDFVVVHAGFAIGRVSKSVAEENLATLELLRNPAPAEGDT